MVCIPAVEIGRARADAEILFEFCAAGSKAAKSIGACATRRPDRSRYAGPNVKSRGGPGDGPAGERDRAGDRDLDLDNQDGSGDLIKSTGSGSRRRPEALLDEAAGTGWRRGQSSGEWGWLNTTGSISTATGGSSCAS
eukprot:872212_1